MAKRMMYSVETLPRMDAEIKRKVDLHTDQTIKGKITFEQQPNMPEGNLNGTNYLMVYGTGTPEENGAELQAAYEAAKKMPRYLGMLIAGPEYNFYAGQIYLNGTGQPSIRRIKANYTGATYSMPESAYDIIDTASNAFKYAKFSTTLIVAPGEYDFGATAFRVNSSGINIVSLTGNADVIVRSSELLDGLTLGIFISADYALLKGIDCKTNTFYIANSLDNLICEYCIGGVNSFGSGGTASGTFNHCTGGNTSFGSGGTASGTFNHCTGGNTSFGTGGGIISGTFNHCIGGADSFGTYGGIISGTFNHCIGGANSFGSFGGTITAPARLYYTRLTSGTFPTPVTGGRLILCIDGNNNIVTI